ncbi:MAG: mechanosensitive ion channel [Bacteroidetes bacterium]|nr:mechanosensitive ion channel [Bacteroidota bacterium]
MMKINLANQVFFDISISLTIILGLYIFKELIVRSINKNIKDLNLKHTYRKTAFYLNFFLTLVLLSMLWLENLNTGLLFTIIGAGLVVTLGDLVLSFVGFLILSINKPFEVGERVQIGEIKGDVVDYRAFYITMLEIGGWVEEEQSTGRIVHIPNYFIFKKVIFNYTKGFDFIWNEIKILLTFESNYKTAEKICEQHVNAYHNSWAENLEKKIKSVQKIYAINYTNLTPIIYKNIKESGVELSIRYLVNPYKRRSSVNELTEKLLNDFQVAKDIDFAYTTYRITK